MVRTTCPDQFLGQNGPVPTGCVSVTVTGNRDSTRIEHHVVPAIYLTAAPPRAKGQKCLVLKGEMAGQVHYTKVCKTRQKPPVVVLSNGITLPLDDTCLVIDTL